MAREDEIVYLPRPLWQLKEELADHLWHRPPNHDLLKLTEWGLKKERLELWIELGEKGARCKNQP